jgi:uncharacterized membrane protein YfcA
MSILQLLSLSLGALALVYAARWATALVESRSLPRDSPERAGVPRPIHAVIGFVTNFFDTLGIGSFATTASAYRLLGLVRDERIPATMLVGHTPPVVTQAFVFISVVTVDPSLLVTLVVSAILGGWLGAGVVSSLPRASIQIGMAIGLLLAALFMLLGFLGVLPGGGTALALPAGRLTIALAANFVLGALVTLGIGNYGPSLVLFSLLGLDLRAIFPVMMGSGAFLGMAAGLRFVAKGRYDAPAALGLTLGGIPGVVLAVWLVMSLPLDVVRWGVIVVVVYTAVMLLRAAATERRGARPSR